MFYPLNYGSFVVEVSIGRVFHLVARSNEKGYQLPSRLHNENETLFQKKG